MLACLRSWTHSQLLMWQVRIKGHLPRASARPTSSRWLEDEDPSCGNRFCTPPHTTYISNCGMSVGLLSSLQATQWSPDACLCNLPSSDRPPCLTPSPHPAVLSRAWPLGSTRPPLLAKLLPVVLLTLLG